MLANYENLSGPTPIELAEAYLENALFDQIASNAEIDRLKNLATTPKDETEVDEAFDGIVSEQQNQRQLNDRVRIALEGLWLAQQADRRPARAPSPATNPPYLRQSRIPTNSGAEITESAANKRLFTADEAYGTSQRSARPLELNPNCDPDFFHFLRGEVEEMPTTILNSRQIAATRQAVIDLGPDQRPKNWEQRFLDYQLHCHPSAR
jgi:hypothetical protein